MPIQSLNWHRPPVGARVMSFRHCQISHPKIDMESLCSKAVLSLH
ncbi:hypothetical protein HMPREF0004_3968 [Achromobacter piechaudii ATCC 43553]|uniref:Uncharacterized protein n=1 Tax=Achromobacter piechaudii ATCC 43553 TaxID=742159 RepID=D4XES1_9BURK|nr:hypothetical protein HMPREF0004_3968 [Achromobacter piechaudii ATCC 43553]